ncbi:MAG: hypothetical protein JNK45_37710 [Myxococcales bacterium]|nr:hypothetical protein [Myxococcales bacterium]
MLAAVRPLLAASMLPPPLSLAPRDASPIPPPCLDRRGGPRRRDAEPVVDGFTAASHRPLPLTFAVGVGGHWALMTGLSCSPHGVLLRALDPRDAALEAPRLDVLAAWRRLGTRMGPQASPLWFSTVCIGARALVAAMAEVALASPLEVVLVPLDDGPALRGRTFHGVLAPLSDPAPHVLGIALGDDALRCLAAAAAPRPLARAADDGARSPRALAVASVSEITGAATPPRELEHHVDVTSAAEASHFAPAAGADMISETGGVAPSRAEQPRRARRRARARRTDGEARPERAAEPEARPGAAPGPGHARE